MNGSPDSLLDIDLGAAAAAFGAGDGQLAEKRDGTVEDVDLQTAGATVDFQGALALIRSLTFEAMHPELVLPPAPMPELDAGDAEIPDWLQPRDSGRVAEAPGVVTHAADEGELLDWLRPAEETAPPAGAEPPVEETAEPAPLPEEQPAASSGPTAEEAAAGLEAAAAAGPGTQVLRGGEVVIPPAAAEKKRWDNIKRGLSSYLETHWKEMAERGVGVAVGAVLGKVAEGSPWVQAGLGMALVGTSVRSRLMDSSGRIGRFIEFRKDLHPEFYRSRNLVKRGISLVVEAEMRVLQGSFWLLERPALEGIGWGLVLQGVADGLTPDKPVGTETPTAVATETSTGTPTPEATPVSPEATQIPGGGEVGGSEAVGGQPPVEQVGPQRPGVSRLPGGETAQIPLEDSSPQPGDAEVLAQQAAAQAEAVRQAAVEAATRVVEVQSGDTLTELVARAGGDPYGADFTNTVLQSADVLTGPQNPNRDMARALIEFIRAHPEGVNWRDAINGVGDLAKEIVGGAPLKDAIAQATRTIYPGQEMKVVVGAGAQ